MKKYLLPLVAIALIFTSCEKSYIIIEGRVYNAKTKEAISDVKITLETTSEKKILEATTNADGFYSLGKVLAGQYAIKIEKAGFLGTIEAIGLGGTDVIMEQTVSKIIYLDPLTEKFEFNVYKRYNFMYEQAVVDQEFMVYLSPAIDPITASTDEFGFVELDSMPATTTVVLEFNFTDDDILYKQSVNMNKSWGIPTSITIDGYIKGGDLGIVETNVLDSQGKEVQDFSLEGSIKITFTQPIDTVNSSITLVQGWNTIQGEEKWNDNNMNYTFRPNATLDWGADYDLIINVINEDNTDSYNTTISFMTEF